MRIYATTRPGWSQDSLAESITDPELFERLTLIANRELQRTRQPLFEVYAEHPDGHRITIRVERTPLFQVEYDFRDRGTVDNPQAGQLPAL